MAIYCTQQLHFSVVQAGIVMGLFGLGAVAGAFIGGRITDKFGFYAVQLNALFSGGIMFIICGYLQTFQSLCIGTFILSICNESFRPANSTAIAYYSVPENRTRSYSLNRLAINLGWAFGGALGGFFASFNYHLLFWVDGITNIIAGIMLLKLLPKAKMHSRHIKTEVIKGLSPYKDGGYVYFIILTIFFAFCFFQLFSLQPLFYKTAWHINEQFIGFLMALNGLLIVFIEMSLVFYLEKKNKPVRHIQWGVFVMGIGFTLVNLLPAGKWTAILVVFFVTAGEMLSMPFMNSFMITRAQESNRGQYAALYTIAWAIAQIAAPAGGSQIIEHWGFTTLWFVIGVTCLVVAICCRWLRPKAHIVQAEILRQAG
ncbi:MAG: transporter [Chitinophagaceae bacterium]|nr:transporter [Chitinophagaceae bacterium]